ncbi:hypothetical protein HCA00_04775 [Listeria booriae]|uniref:Uncharacterized protein n=1 Tax=Listeria booriae TaxID=1552123 RepID=A0A842FM18_9LIST|nr:hypothetical protein [Listeria booriae]MBC2285872.1 hypothetical protein [Listeria booriae]MBC6128097.1 hypothetical protein [Listeria booriae]
MIKKYKVIVNVLLKNGWGCLVYKNIEALSYGGAFEIAEQKAKKSGYKNVKLVKASLQGFDK